MYPKEEKIQTMAFGFGVFQEMKEITLQHAFSKQEKKLLSSRNAPWRPQRVTTS